MNIREREDVNFSSSSSLGNRNANNQLWREMRDAYNVYQNTSEALEALPQSLLDAPRADQHSGIATLETEQRIAFENYIDARLRYSEFARDERFSKTPGLDAPTGKHSTKCDQPRFVEKTILSAANVLLLAVIALGSVYCVHEDERARNAVLARDQMRASLDRTEEDLRELRQVVDRSKPIPSNNTSSRSPTATVTFKKKAKQVRGASKVATVNGRSSFSFTLSPSKTFQQIGPVRLSIRAVDPARKYLLLSVSEGSRVTQRIARLNVPVIIAPPNGLLPVRLAITSIGPNYVHGYLAIDTKVEVTANRSHPGFRSGT